MRRSGLIYIVMLLSAGAATTPATATQRELPDTALPGESIMVQISLSVPPGTTVVAAEDQPPPGWTVSNISNGGSFDPATKKVKWGLFFAPSIPGTLTYQTTVGSGSGCFVGLVSYDGVDTPITGESCTVSIPAVSTWGAIVLSLALLVCGTAVRRSRKTEEEGFEPP